MIVVHCFKDKQLNVSVDTGNLLHLNAKNQIGYMDFKTELEIEDVIGEFEAVGYTLVNLCRPQKKMILSPQLHFEKGNESGSAFTALIYRIVKGRIVFKRGGHVFKKGSVETDLQFVLCYTSNLIHRFHESKVSVFVVSIQH